MNKLNLFTIIFVLTVFPQIFAQGFITVTSPNGGESWQAGSSHFISWNDNLPGNVKIELFKGGAFHSTISTSTTSDGNRSWDIPLGLAAASDYTIKITSVDSASVFDISDANFTVYSPVITVTDPNGGESWIIGDSYLITWTDNIAENVELQLYKGGSFYTSITTSTTSDGSYTWNIPGGTISGSDYKIRIASVDNSNIFDESNSNFTLASQITVISPNNNENWRTGTAQSIIWSDNISENVKIELYKGGSFHSNIVTSTPSTGSYLWTIPGGTLAGTNYEVKITSVSDASTFDFSDANFSIYVGSISVTDPNGGESWQAGTTQSITWTDNISENVVIDLYKGGSFHSIVSTSTSSDGLKSWSIPFALESGSDYQIKITSVDESDIFDFSNSNFTIVGNQVTVTAPNGGENWQPGTSQIISWTDNFSSNVEIQLFKGGAYNSSIVTSTPSDGSYTWDIPGSILPGSDYTIKILSTVDGNIFDFSNASFTIINNDITVNLPNGGEVWSTGSTQSITWSDNISGNVKIELYKAEVFNSTIISSTASDGSYSWNIPGATANGSDYKIKVTSIDLPTLSDLSDNSFTIFTGQITVSSPNGGESWQAGSTQNITWTDNISENVMIELYKGGVFHSVIDASTSSDGTKGWDLPFTLQSGSDYKVKITSVDDPGITDLSNSNFTVVGNQVTVTSPNGGENWQAGSSQIITWTDNLTGNVEIQLFKAGAFLSSITTSTPSDGSYTWNISGSTLAGSDYKINILSVDDGNIFDLSNSNFTISNNNILITSPNGGENWTAGSIQNITWSDDLSGNVKIELYKAEVFNSTIVSSTPSDGLYIWNIPGATVTGSDYKVKITSIDVPTLSDFSNSSFTIFTGQITVTSPDGGESYQAGTSENITWTDNIDENVLIELYKGGTFHSVISTSTSSDGSRVWDIPFALEAGSDYRIKITSAVDPGISDMSNANFTIVANQVTVTAPNGGENWPVGSSQLITWNANFAGNVEIQLFKGGSFQSSITGSTPNDGSHTWNISTSLSQGADYSIRISSVDDGNVFDFSNSNFTISNEVIVTYPNGGESWQRGTTQIITWTNNFSGTVKIELYRGTTTFDSEIIAATPSTGSYVWDIPVGTIPRTNYRIKISSVDNASVFDFSDANFEIYAGVITISSPDGGESWQAGTTQNITWIDNITDNVKIDLYKGGVFNSIISASTTSDGARAWDIPYTLESGVDYTVKVSSVNNPSISDNSNSDFTIVGNQITITTPNGGENWIAGSSQIISWTDNLTGSVEIQLYKGGVFNYSISTSTSSDGSYTWNIPGTLVAGSDYQIRILSNEDGNIFDFSDANFTIINSNLTVNTPNGGEIWYTGTTQVIFWTDDISGDVKIELYQAEVFNSTIVSSTPSDGSHVWNIPGSVASGTNYKIKVSSIDQPSLFDLSDDNFTIFTGQITVTTPNGGETWQAGTTQNVTWTDNIDGSVTIDLYKSGVFHSVISASTSSDGLKSWVIPYALESGSDYSVKVTSLDDPSLFDVSNANFTIIGNQVTVISPNTGVNWLIGSTQLVSWSDNFLDNVEINLYKAGVFQSSVTGSTASDGEYTWNIPSTTSPGNDYKIRISSSADGSIFDESDVNFILSHQITVTSPNGGEPWLAGHQEFITWTDNIPDFNLVKIELYKGGSLNSVLFETADADGSKQWVIPPDITPGTDYRVRVISVDDPTVFDISDADFTIELGTISVTSPNGGENWQAGNLQTITWNDDIADNIIIDLYKGGTFHSNIIASTTSDGAYNWSIPFTLLQGSDYSVKITSVNNPNVFDFSDANFTIVGNQVTVTYPNGGENWIIGSSQIINWTDNLTGSVEIQLFKGGVFHSSIVTSTTSDGTYTWNIPASLPAGFDYRIRVASTIDGSVFDESDADFTLLSQLIVAVPNGGESWQAGSSQTINWTDNLPENVKIELFKGGTFNSPITASTASNGSFVWDIPAGTTAGTDYSIKITSVNSPSVFDVSDANFEIYTGVISVTTPNGGESWQAGTTKSILWTDNIAENITIDLYKGGSFHSIISTSTASDGTRNWSIPFALESGTDYSVKITSVSNPGTFDFSDANFTIVGNQVTVTSPNGGEDWTIGDPHLITWTDNLTGSVEIQLLKGAVFFSSINTSTASDGEYTWNIPGSVEAGIDYSIKIISADDGTIFDISDANFILSNKLAVTAPNGGESWQAGSSQTINWTDNISGDVKIELFKGGSLNSLITSATPSSGSFIWDIPVGTTSGSDYTIMITSVDNSSLFDFSDANFEIFSGIITVTSPNGGENWAAGSTQTINWNDNIGENVKIDLYKGGTFHSLIVASTTSDGSKIWNIPFALESGSDYTVKITSITNPGITDVSNLNFTIIGNQVAVTSPNGGENWKIGSTQVITWTDNLTGSVEIQLFKGGVFKSSITESTPSDGTFTWNIPTSLTQASDYRISISSVDDGTIFDQSDTDFTLSNEIIVTTPNGTESWQAGKSNTIRWTDNISGNVQIELYRGTTIFDSEITSSAPSSGSYVWDIPPGTTPRTNYRIKITSVDNSSIFDFSDANFEIYTGVITVTSPNGGESWQAGTTQNINWIDNINENVTIDLYKGGVFHSIISTSTGSDGSRNWDMPFTLESGTNYRVKITSVNDPGITDLSDADFTIIANQVTVTSPNGGENWKVGSSQIINWTDNLTGNVEIQLYKGGIFHSSITSSTQSDGEYTWNIPTSLVQASDYSIRISSVDSDANFTLSNEIIVVTPNGGERWQRGTTHTISWTDNFSGNVKIELYRGTSIFVSEITPSTPSSGSFSWDIPSGLTARTNYRIKITSVDNSSIFDFSDANFEIFEGIITLTLPNGGESWTAGTTQNILWTDNINENVTIELYKGGTFHSIISTSTSSDGSRVWDLPFTLESGTDYRVKITSVNDPSITDLSDADFTIAGNQITIITPNGGEQWLDNVDQIITWTDNLEGSVEIQLFKNDLFHSSITTSTPSDGEYTWNIPGTTPSASDYKVKIISTDDGNIFDMSNGNFTIINNEITVISPNGGESWSTGTSHEITWSDNITGDVKIELYKSEAFDRVITSSTPSNGSYIWDIPGIVSDGSDYKIKVTSVDLPVLSDISNGSFTIFTGQIAVTSPDGGESWQAGSSQTITWTDNISENVTIDLYKGGTFHSVISTSTTSDGTRSWDIPFALEAGTDYKVKVTSVISPGITDFSDANFTIVANQVTVTSPNGGEDWKVGTSQIISWTDNFTGNVEIQLFKGGIFHSSITSSTPSDGEYTWNISSSLVQASDYSIKISSITDGNVFDFSDSNFLLSNKIIVTTPNGGESWQRGTTNTIRWTDNFTGNVKIELYRNSGGTYDSEITPSAPGTGSFIWDIPAGLTARTNYQIKISSVDNSSIFDFSDANFEIFEGIITVTSPNDGTEIWTAGTTQNISWMDNINENITIELYKGGTLHSIIETSTSSDGARVWDLPFTLESGSDYRVKITSVDDPSITDFSDADFTIVGGEITVTTPNGGEQWLDTDDHIITWTDNLGGSVEIQLFKNDVFHSSITTSTPSDGEYTWNIPGTTPSAEDYKVKIISTNDGNLFDLSDNEFTIINNEITVISPNGGESWLTGSTQQITWSDNITGDVKIELYKSESLEREIIDATPSTGSFDWDVPGSLATGSDYKIKITSVDQPALTDISNSSFTIYTGQITVTSPDGGESWQAGASHNVTWTDNISENLTIELYKGSTFHSVISASTSSDGTKVWDIPFDQESGSDYQVRISSIDNPGIFDFSDSNFTVVANQITITTPNGAEDWLIGSSQIINWTTNFVGSVEIQLFKGGIFHSSITSSTPGDGEYTWNISSSLVQASDYSIRISSVNDGNVFDFSDDHFTLSSELIVTTPNGGESWQRGTAHTIVWSDNITGNVKIELYRGTSIYDSEITPSTPANGSFSWNIPVGLAPRTNYRIKITSLDNSSIFDFSDANFEIFEGVITITSPDGGESWTAGTTQNINWVDNINENVIIELYKGGTFHSIISSSTGSDGSRNWDIPFTIESGTDYKVKISSVDDPFITDISDANFTIVGNQISIISPNGGEEYLVGSTQIINWVDNLIGNVEIQLFKGGEFHSSITTSTSSDGEYTWNISNSLVQGSDYKIRISSVDDGSILDFSDDDFTLLNEVIVTIPNGGESWKQGSVHTINWSDNLVENVKIELFKGGVFDSEISASTPSSGSFSWDIPTSTTTGTDYTIKISSVNNPAVFDISDESFDIFEGNITITIPNGGEIWKAGTTQNISWTDNIDENVTIDLYKGGTFHSIISTSTGSDGSRNWDIPFTLEAGSDYKVKVTSVDDPTVTDISDASFTIEGNQITVTSPNGGEDFLVGSTQIINWTDDLVGNVEIQLFKGGVFHSSITTSTSSDGEYTWNISGSLVQADDYRIRISSVDDGSILDFSDNDFTLSNEVIVTIPNGSESWQRGITHTINWTDNLSENVKIDLLKNGIFNSTITPSSPSNGSFTWDIPITTVPGTDYTIKVLSINNPAVFDISDASFEIYEGNITVTKPQAGDTLTAGTTQVIRWDDNINENVVIDLYKGGAFHSIITTSTSSDGARSWDIPFTVEFGTDYSVKVTSIDDPAITDFSDNFTIIDNYITVDSPNGGEEWLDTDDHQITWTDNLAGSVEIQLLKGGSFYSSITTSTPSDGSYTWNIPGTTPSGSDYRIKIISVNDGNIFDQSENEFTIINNDITVTSPNGGESWLTGSTQEITWFNANSGDVKIELYKGEVSNLTIVESTPGNGSYFWEVPTSITNGADYKIKITSVDQSAIFDFSNNTFEIYTGAITVKSPNGGESWQAGTTQNITWDDNIPENVKIELFKGGLSHSVIEATTTSDGSKIWDIPFALEAGNDYKIKISSIENPGLFDFSDDDFNIVGNEITVTKPNDGTENWAVGTAQIISWTDNLSSNVEIQLFKAGVFHSSITGSTPSDGQYTWNISSTLVQGDDYKIKISSVDDGNVFDFSDNDFTLTNDITVTVPNGGESWQAGTQHNITWSDNITGNVKIELLRNGVFEAEITASTASSGAYSWNIPTSIVADTTYKIKILNVDNPAVFDISDANFEIFEGNITVTKPNDGTETWTAGTTQNINWIDNINESVTIDLYKGGEFHSIISTATASDGSKIWDIPFTQESGNDYSVKISSVDDENIYDFSDNNFTIEGIQITVISPNGGENWLESDDHLITWTDNLAGNVEIQLLKNGIFHSSITSSTSSDGQHPWNPPAAISTGSDYQIKILSVDDGNVNDVSDGDFTIISDDLTVTSPNGGENWLIGTTQTITWTDDIESEIKIELYQNELPYYTIIATTPSEGFYNWSIPDTTIPGSNYKIKISSVDQPGLFDMSNTNFALFVGSIEVVSPNGGESWQAGTSQPITWIDNITEDVMIDLYKGGQFHSVISTLTGSDGSKNWDIPFSLEPGSDYKVKITNVENEDVFDFSDSNFTIVGNQISVISPNGGENWLETDDQQITWTDNLTGNVEIQLLKNDTFHSSITTSTASDGEYTWNPSNSIETGFDYKIKILSVEDGNVFDISDSNFTIINNFITVTSPNGGENWLLDHSYEISWTDDLPGNVKIELYDGDESPVTTIASSIESISPYLWIIPESGLAEGINYKIKITSVDQPDLYDMTNDVFSVSKGLITVAFPDGDEKLLAGEQYTVTWNDNVSGDVKIELFKDDNFHSTIIEPTPSDGSKTWDIPFNIKSDTTYKIKITSLDNDNVFDFSDNNFAIEGFAVTILSPNEDENLFTGSSTFITWNSNLTGNVEIQLFKGGEFHSIITGSTSNDGSYSWNISASITTDSDYKIKIASVIDDNIFDFSDNEFSIISNHISVTSPNGGENWLIGSAQEISWTDDISGNVQIDLYKGGILHSVITPSTPSDGSFEWNFSGATMGSDYKIMITSIDLPALRDSSNNNFTLFTGDITISSPNGGESWKAGSAQTIFWADNISGNVTIDLYRSDTLNSIISEPTSSDGARDWQVPFDLESGNDYKVKITSVENDSIFDFSDAYFSIEGFEISVTSPNGGEVWYVGQDYNITWNDNLAGNVEIHLWKDGIFHSVIDASDPSDGIKTWSIPPGQETGSDFQIRIASLENSNIFDLSDNTFSLSHSIVVEAPNGGESWQAGSDATIAWTDNLTGNIKIELWKAGVFHSIVESSALSNGNYTWRIDSGIPAGTDYKIKIISIEDTADFDFSDDNFEIFAGSITVVSPNGGEIWQAGTDYSINWNSDIGENVKIDLYKGGSLHSTIVTTTTNDGTYSWTEMPFTIESGDDYQVRISSVTNPNTFDLSDGKFTIVGNEITITTPNGGETWIIGEPYFITWEDNLTGSIEILLYKGNILKYVIDSGDPSDGSKTWTIPAAIQPGSDYKIKIASLEESVIFDFSDAEFTITDVTSVENITNAIPDIYQLYQNYPNPFNPQTKIEFGLPEESTVSLKIYDLTGQEVDVVLNNENLFAGTFRFDFDASYLPSGIYFYILIAKSNISDLAIKETKKMILMK
jgi:surfactin synthase thioesterase subunit